MANPSPRASPQPRRHADRARAPVLRWLARGKTDRDIASVLGISTRTVQKHLQHVYVKLGVETRTAAVVRGMAGCRPTMPPMRGALAASENAL